MPLPANKTKIVCTIGPASDSPAVMEEMIRAGMNVARLNFSHGEFSEHGETIRKLRAAAETVGKPLAIMADLPGPKMRIGHFEQEPVELKQGSLFTLTTATVTGDLSRASVSFPQLPRAVKPGNTLFLNDGMVQLEVIKVEGEDVLCRVLVGGELRSRKGLNLPGIDLGIMAFTDHDRECLKFALENGVDAVSQSFVESPEDVTAVREAAANLGYQPFIIAKIERSGALDHMDGILQAADGVMIARGDLGVEIPIEEIAVVQKRLTRQANLMGRPVITATQMLESMTGNRRPTRAEATDVANAILDGTDCVMLSEESATGKYPVDAVVMLAKIAAAIEPNRPPHPIHEVLQARRQNDGVNIEDLIALSVETTFRSITPAAVVVPTLTGATARRITRFRLPVWVLAVSSELKTCQDLLFSYGVTPVREPDHPTDWRTWIRTCLRSYGVEGNIVLLTEGPSRKHPHRNNRMEIIDLTRT
jgi:pyruvate kinase